MDTRNLKNNTTPEIGNILRALKDEIFNFEFSSEIDFPFLNLHPWLNTPSLDSYLYNKRPCGGLWTMKKKKKKKQMMMMMMRCRGSDLDYVKSLY